MAFDVKAIILANIAGIEPLLKAAYQQGCMDTRNAILAAAGAPVADTVGVGDRAEATIRSRKAPRGTVPKILGRMLTEHPGKTIAEYEEMSPQYDDRISTRSIGGELRRMEGKRYRRNDDGEWFLIKSDEEAAGTDTNENPATSDDW